MSSDAAVATSILAKIRVEIEVELRASLVGDLAHRPAVARNPQRGAARSEIAGLRLNETSCRDAYSVQLHLSDGLPLF
jgi:hypothetical protein